MGGERDQFVTPGDDKDAIAGDGRRGMHRRRDILAPDDTPIGWVERNYLRIPGRDVEPVVPETRPTAERAAAQLVWLQIDLPDLPAAGGVERAHLDPAIHSENLPLGDHRLRHDAGITRRAVAD